MPSDIQKVILEALRKEAKATTAQYAMEIIAKNIEAARNKSQPICQDTGTLIFSVAHPVGFNQGKFTKIVKKAVVKATQMGYLRQNSVDTLTGENKGMNVGPGHPVMKFHEHGKKTLEVKLMLKGGGSENVSTQYSLPHVPLDAGRDLAGVRKVILDGLIKAQGKGCGPGILGICIGADRGEGYKYAKEQLFRPVDDVNPVKELANLEKDIVESANKLGIGPMGFGGNTTILGCKICAMNRLPASYYVSISYMCWASRRQGAALKADGTLGKWIY
jgi:fumarate hydratase class I